jgi:HK97 family phage prohead protease
MSDTLTAPSERTEFRHVAPFELTRSAVGEDGLTMEGYAAVFDSPTTIQGMAGEFTETIRKGAFAKTIESRTPVLMFEHGKHPLFGQMPIGVIRHLAEDDRGLFVRARLSQSWLVEPIREAIANDAITGMSFRMQVMQDEWEGRGIRRISEVRCPELGPVVMPAYLDTEVSVRSRQVAEALTDPEVRAELARMFTDTGTDGAAPQGTPPGEAVDSNTGEPHQRSTPRPTDSERRMRALQLRGVIPE